MYIINWKNWNWKKMKSSQNSFNWKNEGCHLMSLCNFVIFSGQWKIDRQSIPYIEIGILPLKIVLKFNEIFV